MLPVVNNRLEAFFVISKFFFNPHLFLFQYAIGLVKPYPLTQYLLIMILTHVDVDWSDW